MEAWELRKLMPVQDLLKLLGVMEDKADATERFEIIQTKLLIYKYTDKIAQIQNKIEGAIK